MKKGIIENVKDFLYITWLNINMQMRNSFNQDSVHKQKKVHKFNVENPKDFPIWKMEISYLLYKL
jgi:hypothetical protein